LVIKIISFDCLTKLQLFYQIAIPK
jgi:hypothetical protein